MLELPNTCLESRPDEMMKLWNDVFDHPVGKEVALTTGPKGHKICLVIFVPGCLVQT